MSSRLGRSVRLRVAEAWADEATGSASGFEWFVCDPAVEGLGGLVEDEVGCHVALRLAPDADPARVHAILDRWTREAGRGATLTPVQENREIGVQLFYLDVARDRGRNRRLEFVRYD